MFSHKKSKPVSQGLQSFAFESSYANKTVSQLNTRNVSANVRLQNNQISTREDLNDSYNKLRGLKI